MSLSSNEKSQITVLACCNAGGYAIPPLVIFDRKSLKPEMALGEVPGTMYALSDSGWMDAEIFESWFASHFLAYVPPSRPLLLLMDGHSSHFSPLFVNRAADENIIVFCLPPHSTHKTQPLDKGVFGPLKRVWREECHRYLCEHPGKVISRYQFSYLFGRTWMQAMTPHNICKGFEVTGIYPINRHKILPKKSPKSSTLTERTGLKFLPLLTPVRRSLIPTYGNHDSLLDESESWHYNSPPPNSPPLHPNAPPPCNPLLQPNPPPFQPNPPPFQPDPPPPLQPDPGPLLQPTLQKKPYCNPSLPPPLHLPPPLQPYPDNIAPKETVLKKIIRAQSVPPSIKYPNVQPKSTARVITSKQCREEINDKHQKKMQAIEQKRIRKLEREQKKEEKRKKIEETHIQREQKSKEDHYCVIICKKQEQLQEEKEETLEGHQILRMV